MSEKHLPIWEVSPERRAEAIEAAYALLNLLERRGLDRKSMEEVKRAFRESGLIE
jgi:hypothetical protein